MAPQQSLSFVCGAVTRAARRRHKVIQIASGPTEDRGIDNGYLSPHNLRDTAYAAHTLLIHLFRRHRVRLPTKSPMMQQLLCALSYGRALSA